MLTNEGKAGSRIFRTNSISGDSVVDIVALVGACQRSRGRRGDFGIGFLHTGHHAGCAIDEALNRLLGAFRGLVAHVHFRYGIGYGLGDFVHRIAHAGLEVGDRFAGGILRFFQCSIVLNHFGEISRLTRAVAPTVGLITNIGVSHIENLGSRAGILQAKLEILEGMAPDAPLIVNIDNDMLRTVKLGDRPLLTFAIDDQSADFTATDIAEQGSTTTFTVHHSTFTRPVTIPTVGIHNVYNALAAMAVGYVTGVNPAAAAAALANYVPAGMRQNLVQVGGVQVIEDCYNASPDSMRAALQTLGKLPVHRRYAVLGAMLELGDYAKEAHTQVGKMAAENGIDGVLAYGADAAYIVEAAKQAGLENARWFDTKEALAQSLAQQVQPGDGVLFKGSRGMHLEDVMHTVYERWEKA